MERKLANFEAIYAGATLPAKNFVDGKVAGVKSNENGVQLFNVYVLDMQESFGEVTPNLKTVETALDNGVPTGLQIGDTLSFSETTSRPYVIRGTSKLGEQLTAQGMKVVPTNTANGKKVPDLDSKDNK